MTIRPLKQVDQDAAAGEDPTFPSALGKDDQLLRSLDISKSTSKPLPTLPRISLSVFLKNVPKSAIKTKLPRPQQRIERTDQLVYCNSLLLQESHALSSSEQEPTLDKDELAWLTEIKNDPMERDRLQWLATRMVEAFVQDTIKDTNRIVEIVALGPILEKESYRKLLSSLITGFEESPLMDTNLLQGLVQLAQSSSPGHLVSDDLVKILSILRIRLQGTHQQSTEHPYYLTLAISRVLDVMADHKIQDLDRVLEHEPLSGVLSGLKGSTDPYLMYQACYAFQALQYVPNNETVLQAVLRHSRGVVDGVVKITALGKLDLGSVLEGLGNLQDALGNIIGVAGTVYEGTSSLMESGQGVMESLKERYGAGQKRPWYAAIRAAYALAEAGQLKDLNCLICEAPCRRDPLFQWGICQLLGEVAIDLIWSATSRQQANELLGRLYKNDPEWGRDESVKAWMLTIIDKVGSIADQEVAANALALKQELSSGDTPATRHPYPLRSRLPIPATSPILAKVQDIPYLEYELYKLRLQRLQEYDERAIYVLPEAKPSLLAKDDELFPLLEKVLEFLASDCQVMLILGDSGSGKSTFNRYLEHLLWKEYKRGGPIPLFINLPAIDEPQNNMVDKQLQFLNFDEDQIMELKLHRQLILICDGYDESQQLVNLHRTNSLNQTGQWDTKMVISCRSQYLGRSYQDRFKPQPTDRYKSTPQRVFQEAVIAPFSEEQIEDYIEQYVPLEPRTWSTEDYMDKLTTIPNLMDLVTNPFLLLLALEALPDVTKGNQDLSTIKIVRIQLYDTFVNHWLNVNNRRLQSNPLSKQDYDMLGMLEDAGFEAMGVDYCTRLASAMFEKLNGKAVVQYLHLKDKTTWKVEYFGPDPEVRLLREASPVTRSGTHFQFLHRSMLEYFFSCTVVRSSTSVPVDECAPQSTPDSSDVQSLDPMCPLFTRNLLDEPPVIQFLSERVQENPIFKGQLLEVVERTKSDVSLGTAAANAISILVRAGVTFHRHDFRGIRIPGADLSGGQFDSALFQGADLRGANLGMSWLRKADFSNALMEGVRFGELPYLEEDDDAWSCCYSPDGRMLAVGQRRGAISLYDISTWKKIRSLLGHDGDIEFLAFSPDSRWLVSGSEDKAVRVWDCSSGDPLATMNGHTRNVLSVEFSPCGKKVASASLDKSVRLWDSVTGEPLFVLEGHKGAVNSVKFTPDGRRLVSCGDDKTIRFWDVETGAPGDVWELDLGPVVCLDISPDGHQLVSGHHDGTLRLWSTASGSAGLDLHGHTNAVVRALFSADGQRIASASSDSTVKIWDVSSGVLVSEFNGNNSLVDISFSSNGQHLASTDGSREVRLWDASSSGCSLGQRGHSHFVRTVAYLPTGQFIWSGSMDKSVLEWDARTGTVGSAHALPIEFVYSIAFSPNTKHTAVAHGDESIQLWDLGTGELGPALEGHTGIVVRLIFSPCGKWIASASKDKTVRLWEPESTEQGHVLANMDCGTFSNCTVTFSPIGQQLAAGDVDGTVNIFDTQSKTLFRTTTLEGERISALAYSPNGQELAIGANGLLFFWDLQSKEPDLKLEVDPSGTDCIAYSPCGRWIACGSYGNTVQLCGRYSSGMGAECVVAVVDGFLGLVTDIAWNPVEPLEFVTSSNDRSVRVWRISKSNDSDGVVSVDLIWGSDIGMLGTFGMILEGVTGLDATNRKLLLQRDAVDDTLTSKANEAEVGSSCD
ncbi:hypothetical protein KI688_004909 [Linnemannia hyalina]|uniref:WD40 repeat-like protein n=1 Tax=Linnemannia hyalina TaxID=64524 RepID=A0A9P8BR66_9FUNG|nr:hypothetical protein KI688_004909 [Linnemannia hyalina]